MRSAGCSAARSAVSVSVVAPGSSALYTAKRRLRRGEGATPDTFHPPTPGHAAAPAQAEEQQEEEMRLRNGTFLTLLAFCFCIFLSLSWYTAFSGQKGENPTPWTISATSCVSAILLGRPLTAGGTYKFSLLCDGWVVISVIRRMERRRRVLDPWAQV